MKNKSLNKLLYKLFFMEIWRNKQGLVFLICVPVIFFSIAVYTSTNFPIPLRLYNFSEIIKLVLSQKQILVLYIVAAAVGFLSAYYCMVIFQESLSYYKYCVFMGLSVIKYLLVRMLFFITIVFVITGIICPVIALIIDINQFGLFYLGYIFLGLIYGLYGGITGVITNNFLTSFLTVIMLTNIDVGWLQNPVFYNFADNTLFIRFLPAFFPCQLIFTSAYTDKINIFCILISVLYSFVLFIVLVAVLKIILPKPKKGL